MREIHKHEHMADYRGNSRCPSYSHGSHVAQDISPQACRSSQALELAITSVLPIFLVFVLTYRLHVTSSLPSLLPDRRQRRYRICGEPPRECSAHVVRRSHVGRPSVRIPLGRWRQRVRRILMLVSGRLRTTIIRHLYQLGVSMG